MHPNIILIPPDKEGNYSSDSSPQAAEDNLLMYKGKPKENLRDFLAAYLVPKHLLQLCNLQQG
jgi:hypothetical protein